MIQLWPKKIYLGPVKYPDKSVACFSKNTLTSKCILSKWLWSQKFLKNRWNWWLWKWTFYLEYTQRTQYTYFIIKLLIISKLDSSVKIYCTQNINISGVVTYFHIPQFPLSANVGGFFNPKCNFPNKSFEIL